MTKALDLGGQRFGRLVALRQTTMPRSGHATWLCLCDCGKEGSVRAYRLVAGRTKSCGCLRKELKKHENVSARRGAFAARRTAMITDEYVKGIIQNRTGLRFKDIPPEWIELHRFQIKLKRELKNAARNVK